MRSLFSKEMLWISWFLDYKVWFRVESWDFNLLIIFEGFLGDFIGDYLVEVLYSNSYSSLIF